MSTPDWPSSEVESRGRQPALPRVDDLPVAEQGYDRDAVREAFDAFYRHAAQLDATLRTLETVEVFQRTASELRAELRTVRAAGWTVGGYQRAGYGVGSSVREWSLPPAFPRVALEALFLIVIGVIVGVAGWSRIAIVLVMALALAIVWLVEWVASRERAIPPAAAPATPPRLDEPAEPAELPAAEAAGWSAFSEQEEGAEALTMLSGEQAVAPVPTADAAAKPSEETDEVPAPGPAVSVPEPEVEPEPEPEPVETTEDVVARAASSPEPARIDPWEREAMLPDEAEGEAVAAPETSEQEPEARPGWFRRRREPEPEPEPELDPDDLPVEAVAEQAAAALEQSRGRGRGLRRARRR